MQLEQAVGAALKQASGAMGCSPVVWGLYAQYYRYPPQPAVLMSLLLMMLLLRLLLLLSLYMALVKLCNGLFSNAQC